MYFLCFFSGVFGNNRSSGRAATATTTNNTPGITRNTPGELDRVKKNIPELFLGQAFNGVQGLYIHRYARPLIVVMFFYSFPNNSGVLN